MESNVPDCIAKNTPRKSAATMYVATFWLSPPRVTLTMRASRATMLTPRRLQRSARIPDGVSSSGTTPA
jgi:hypothetical protein